MDSMTLHLRIPESLHERLRSVACVDGTTVNAEARRRLEWSMAAPQTVSPPPAMVGLVLPPDLQERVLAYGRRLARGLEPTLESAVVELLERALRNFSRPRKRAE